MDSFLYESLHMLWSTPLCVGREKRLLQSLSAKRLLNKKQ